ncbi:glycosyltransferase family 2 protein [Halomicrococcus sp. SG-WS-1]|uniref:glycosyltransferase family 2 protein n=1 Tax=Halomicrococcus sp. SG-WS-1 TaxID=3439057 RepID=UPI003F7A38E7
MYEDKTVAVVVPAYNEEAFVGGVIDTVPDFVDRVYAVDDCSTDDTWAEITARADDDRERVGALVDGAGEVDVADDADGRQVESDGGVANGPRVVPIRHRRNRGVGAAIKTGYCAARDDGMDVTAVMAGDGQMDPAMLERVVEPVVDGRADYAKGDRLSYPEYRGEMSGWRSFGNWLLTYLTKVASGYWGVVDPQNGYTAISLRALEAVDVEDVYDDYGFANALLVRLNVAGMRVADVAMPAVYGDEESHIRYATFVPKLSALLAHNFLWRLKTKYLVRDCHPLAFLYGLGAVGTGAGLVAALRRGGDSEGASDDGNDGTSDAATRTLVGLLTLALATIFDRLDDEDLHVREEP